MGQNHRVPLGRQLAKFFRQISAGSTRTGRNLRLQIYSGGYHELLSRKSMPSQIYQLGFIGAGKLAGSVIRGLVRAKFCAPGDIIASEPNEQTRASLQRETGVAVTAENAEAAENSQTIFVGIKPGMVLGVMRDLAQQLGNKQVISLAGGVRIASMEK